MAGSTLMLRGSQVVKLGKQRYMRITYDDGDEGWYVHTAFSFLAEPPLILPQARTALRGPLPASKTSRCTHAEGNDRCTHSAEGNEEEWIECEKPGAGIAKLKRSNEPCWRAEGSDYLSQLVRRTLGGPPPSSTSTSASASASTSPTHSPTTPSLATNHGWR